MLIKCCLLIAKMWPLTLNFCLTRAKDRREQQRGGYRYCYYRKQRRRGLVALTLSLHKKEGRNFVRVLWRDKGKSKICVTRTMTATTTAAILISS